MSEANKHTPAPWKIWTSVSDGSVNVSGQNSQFVCCVGVDAKGEPETQDREVIQANAHLIAAAPELLEALQIIAAILNQDDETSYVSDDREGAIGRAHFVATQALKAKDPQCP